MRLLLGDGQVVHAVGNDRELAGAEHEIAVAQAQPQPALHHEKQLVLPLVVVPYELALEFHELHVGVVHVADDFGLPMILESPEHLREVHDARCLRSHGATSLAADGRTGGWAEAA